MYDVFNQDLVANNYWEHTNSFIENSNWDAIIQRASVDADAGLISTKNYCGVFKIFDRSAINGERRQWYAVLLFFPREAIISIDIVKVLKHDFLFCEDCCLVDGLREGEDFFVCDFRCGEVICGKSKISNLSRRVTSLTCFESLEQCWMMINTKFMKAKVFFNS